MMKKYISKMILLMIPLCLLTACVPTYPKLPDTYAGKPVSSLTVEDVERLGLVDQLKPYMDYLPLRGDALYEDLKAHYGDQVSDEVIRHIVKKIGD